MDLFDSNKNKSKSNIVYGFATYKQPGFYGMCLGFPNRKLVLFLFFYFFQVNWALKYFYCLDIFGYKVCNHKAVTSRGTVTSSTKFGRKKNPQLNMSYTRWQLLIGSKLVQHE